MIITTIAGRVGQDAEAKKVGGTDMCSFSVAAESGFGDRKQTHWFDVSNWGAGSHGVARYIKKGDNITVSGELSTREHNGKTYLQLRADRVELQGGKSGGRDEGRQDNRSSLSDDLGGDTWDTEAPF